MSKVREAMKKLGDAVTDFSTLSVTTYTGDISVLLKKDDASFHKLSELDFDEVLQKALSGAGTTADAKLNLVALNTYKFDGDGIVFRGAGINEELEKAHNEALKAGKETREGILNLVKDAL